MSDTDCQTCKNVTGIVYFQLNDQCLQNCPDGYWGKDSENLCYLCDFSCSKCYDEFNNTCTACTTYNNTIYYLQYGTDTCVDVCPDGQYENATAHKCLPCDSNCATCDIVANNCTSCFLVNGYYVFLDINICVQNCPDGEYEDSVTRLC